MNKAKEQSAQTESVISTIGESYEYIRVIAKNKLEIKKLEGLKLANLVLGKLFLIAIISIISCVIGLLLIILMTYGFYTLLDSMPYAILSSVGILMLLSITFYLLRGYLFYKVIENRLNKLAN